MNVRVNCNECRKRVLKEAEKIYAENQYDILENAVDTAAEWAAAITIAVLGRQGKPPDEIKAFFEDFCFVSSMSEVFGKRITMNDAIKQYEKDYNIDFDKIEVHLESKKQFVSRYLKAEVEKTAEEK